MIPIVSTMVLAGVGYMFSDLSDTNLTKNRGLASIVSENEIPSGTNIYNCRKLNDIHYDEQKRVKKSLDF